MGKDTPIEWCDSTINPTSGCDGCELWNGKDRTCYAGWLHEVRLTKSFPEKYASDFTEVRMIPGRMQQAANWPDLRGIDRPGKPWLNGKPRHIFVGDMGDFLSREVTDDYLEHELFGAITSKNGQRHVWMLLTKRPKRLAKLSKKWGGLPKNVIAMTTVTSQRTAHRIEDLTEVVCFLKGVSIEPLLGKVDLGSWLLREGCARCNHDWIANYDIEECPECGYYETYNWSDIDFVIVGGESGKEARPTHPSWVREIRDDCLAASVPFFFKQWGELIPVDQSLEGSPISPSDAFPKSRSTVLQLDGKQEFAFPPGAMTCLKIGKKNTGRLLDGREHNGFPEVLR